MFTVGERVRILIDMADMETVGYIDDINELAFPGENSPYRVINESSTECLGWFSEQELESIEEI